MSEGLTRRRGAQPTPSGSSTPPANSSQPTTPIPGSSSHNNHNNPRGSLSLPGNPTAGSSSSTGGVEGRSKIAFDPRDYENGSMGGERERMPRLTVMEEVLLLGLKDKQVSLRGVRARMRTMKGFSRLG